MSAGNIWSVLHASLFAVWLAAGTACVIVTSSVKHRALAFSVRRQRASLSRRLQILPRACFALMLPIGLELTAGGKIYPLDPEMRIAFWTVGGLWLIALLVRLRYEDGSFEKGVGYAEIAFEGLAGMGFVVYGLNSLATGAPIDDPWFAAKLFLIGVALWTLIAIDLNFRSLAWPLEEIALDGSTPENEEALSRAANYTSGAMIILYILLVAVGLVRVGMAV